MNRVVYVNNLFSRLAVSYESIFFKHGQINKYTYRQITIKLLIMNYINQFLFLFVLIACLSCGGATANVETAENETVADAKKATLAKAKTVKHTIKDSIPAKSKVQYKPRTNNSNYIVSTSRKRDEIEQNFPYDIALRRADGSETNSAEILKKNGKPTILLFWLTTCYPCKIEMKAIKEKFPKWRSETDFNLVAISTDFEKNYGKFQEMVKANKWGWKTYHDFNREFRYVMPGELNGLPQTFIIDKDGEIVYHKRKYSSGDEDKLYAKVKALAAK